MAERTAILRIVEEDENVIHAVVQTSIGEVTVMANMVREPHRLLLNQIHIEGKGLTRVIIKKAANELGIKEGVGEVVLQDGVRTSGANLGSIPKPIFVEVDQ